MKKFLFAIIGGSIPSLAMTNETFAQSINNLASRESIKHVFIMNKFIPPGEKHTVSPDAINNRAIRNFKKSYKSVSDEEWSEIADGFKVTFTLNGTNNSIFYGRKGHWMASLKAYPENQLPLQVIEPVKSEYNGYKIKYVQEIQTTATHGTPTYIVYAENHNGIKLIRVSGDQMDIYYEYNKQ